MVTLGWSLALFTVVLKQHQAKAGAAWPPAVPALPSPLTAED